MEIPGSSVFLLESTFQKGVVCSGLCWSFWFGSAMPGLHSGRGCPVDPAVAWLPWELSPRGEAALGTWPDPGLVSTGGRGCSPPGPSQSAFPGHGGVKWEGTGSSMETVPGGLKMAPSSLPHCHPRVFCGSGIDSHRRPPQALSKGLGRGGHPMGLPHTSPAARSTALKGPPKPLFPPNLHVPYQPLPVQPGTVWFF